MIPTGWGGHLPTGDDLHRGHRIQQELHRELRGGAARAEQEVLRQPRQLHERLRQRERVPVGQGRVLTATVLVVSSLHGVTLSLSARHLICFLIVSHVFLQNP